MKQRGRKPYRPPCFGQWTGHTEATRDASLGLKGMKESYCSVCGGVFYRFRVDEHGKTMWRENRSGIKPKYNRR